MDLTYGVPTANFWMMILWSIVVMSFAIVHYVYVAKRMKGTNFSKHKVSEITDVFLVVLIFIAFFSNESLSDLMETTPIFVITGFLSMFSVGDKFYAMGYTQGIKK